MTAFRSTLASARSYPIQTMATKHDVLTEEEMSSFELASEVLQTIETLASRSARRSRGSLRILDWGCGRGRSVAKLRELGFSAFGVDIDPRALRNGHDLLRGRGLDPAAILLDLECATRLPDGEFDVIFSEQVLEHVLDLEKTAAEVFRLSAPGGLGVHTFPGSRTLWESHVAMPLVHWLRNKRARRGLLALCHALGMGPGTGWPELHGRTFGDRVRKLSEYLDTKTFYRDVEAIVEVLRETGFEATHTAPRPAGLRLLPGNWSRNGFPDGMITVRTRKSRAVSRARLRAAT